MKTRQSPSADPRSTLHGRLAKYGVAAAASAVTMGASDEASGAITVFDNGGSGWTSGFVNNILNITASFPGTSVNASVDTSAASNSGVFFSKSVSSFVNSATVSLAAGHSGGAGVAVGPLSYGAPINSVTNYPGSGGTLRTSFRSKTKNTQFPYNKSYESGSAGPWGNNQRAYLGLRFESGAGAHYGWAEITVSTSTVSTSIPARITLHAFGIESVAGAGVTAGDPVGVPEPTQVALLALGAAGLTALRSRQRKKSA